MRNGCSTRPKTSSAAGEERGSQRPEPRAPRRVLSNTLNPSRPMSRAFFRRSLVLLLVAGFALAGPLRALEQNFTTSSTLSTEAVTLLRLLEEDHYNRD